MTLNWSEHRTRALLEACNAIGRHSEWGKALDDILSAATAFADTVGIYASPVAGSSVWLLIGHHSRSGVPPVRYWKPQEGEGGFPISFSIPRPEIPDAMTLQLVLPVILDEVTVAVLALQRSSPPAFNRDDIRVGSALASLVGEALRAGALHQRIQHFLAERASVHRLTRSINESESVQHLLDTVTPILIQLFNAQAGLLYLLPWNGEGEPTYSVSCSSPDLPTRIQQLSERWIPTLAGDSEGTILVNGNGAPPEATLLGGRGGNSALLLGGITVAGRTMGFVAFERALSEAPPFTESESELLAVLVSQLGTAIENVQARAHHSWAFRELSQFPYSALSLDEIPQRILEKVQLLFPSLGSWIAIFDPLDDRPQLKASIGLKPGGVDLSWTLPEHLQPVPTGKPGVWVLQRNSWPVDLPWPVAEADSLLVASMSAQDSYIGSIVMALGPNEEPSPQRQILLSSLALQAGLVIHSASLFTTSQELVVQEERSRIAREIHDGVAQNLALLMLRMEIISRVAETDTARVKDELAKVSAVLESSVHELRRAIYTLRSPDLARLGLVRALKRLARDYTEQTNIPVALSLPPALPLAAQAQSAIFNFVQERLDQVAREGSAVRISVSLSVRRSQLCVVLRDGGRRSAPRNGVANEEVSPWQQRLLDRGKSLGWDIRVQVRPTETRVRIEIPLGDGQRAQD